MNRPIFLDTNVINNDKEYDRLFGCRATLERVAKHYKIIVPQVVLDELLEHKRRRFTIEKDKLLRNGILQFANIDLKPVKQLEFDKVKDAIRQNETISFEVFEPKNYDSFIRQFYRLAVEHRPPFEEESDKGFKDALIAFSIKEYIEEYRPKLPVILVTADKRLGSYFHADNMVVVYKNLNQLLNANNGNNHDASNDDRRHDLAASASLSDQERVDLAAAVRRLCNSGSFAMTHSAVDEVAPFQNYLTAAQKQEILRSAVTNNQITWLLQDPDVKNLIDPLFREYQDVLTDREYSVYVDSSGRPNNRLDDQGNVRFSRSERSAYLSFADDLVKHIEIRSWMSKPNLDSDEIVDSLNSLLAQGSLDPHVLSWQAVANIFFEGDVTADASDASLENIQSFADFLSESDRGKRDAIISSLASRLEMVDMDIPF